MALDAVPEVDARGHSAGIRSGTHLFAASSSSSEGSAKRRPSYGRQNAALGRQRFGRT